MSKRIRRERRVLRDSTRELRSAIRALYKLAPCGVIVGVLLVAAIIAVSLLSVQLMMGTTILVVVLVSVVVYSRTDSYGEAALALVAGLLTAFTVEWTTGSFIAFIVAWAGLSLTSFLISSIKLAAQVEEVYSDAARSIDPTRYYELRGELQKIGNDSFIKMLGPVKRAEVIRLFAFRKLPTTSMQYGLRAVEMLSTVTSVEHQPVAEYVADVYKMFRSTPGPRYQKLLDRVYQIMRTSCVSPGEFITAFRDSRHLALSGEFDPESYFEHLTAALDKGVAPDDVYEYLRDQLEEEP
jgi:hypothetical protein